MVVVGRYSLAKDWWDHLERIAAEDSKLRIANDKDQYSGLDQAGRGNGLAWAC